MVTQILVARHDRLLWYLITGFVGTTFLQHTWNNKRLATVHNEFGSLFTQVNSRRTLNVASSILFFSISTPPPPERLRVNFPFCFPYSASYRLWNFFSAFYLYFFTYFAKLSTWWGNCCRFNLSSCFFFCFFSNNFVRLIMVIISYHANYIVSNYPVQRPYGFVVNAIQNGVLSFSLRFSWFKLNCFVHSKCKSV